MTFTSREMQRYVIIDNYLLELASQNIAKLAGNIYVKLTLAE